MHIDTQSVFPLHLHEARLRWFTYPPPYKQGQTWYYVTPWLWYDGDPHCYEPNFYDSWDSLITDRMAVPSPVTITMWGNWNPGTGAGTISAKFRNESAAELVGHVLFVITEDSIYFAAPSGDLWHNQVARDYIPDHIGDLVTIPANDSITSSQAFTLDPLWNPEKIRFVTFIQDTVMQPDSTIEIWQGAMLDIDQLGILEYGSTDVARTNIKPVPNPCVDGTRFAFVLPAGERFHISFFDVSGRMIRTVVGTATGSEETITWNLRDEKGVRISAGVYLYRFESEKTNTAGKVVVR